MTTVEIADSAEAASLVATIVLAFDADPMARWSLTDPQRYLMHMPDLVRAFAGRAFAQGSAFHIGGAAAALWLPPGTQPDVEALVGVLQRGVPEQHQEAVFAVLEQMDEYHPTQPHWYLPLIGVDPIQQGNGYGSLLLEVVISRCDRDKVPAYLESSNPRNIPLYERHGFEAIGRIQSASSPVMVPMVRQPRSGKN